MTPETIKFSTRVLRKQENLPRYIVIKGALLSGRTKTFAADVTLNGAGPFSRNVHPWGKGSDAFFFNLTAPQCEKAQLNTNDPCDVEIVPKQ